MCCVGIVITIYLYIFTNKDTHTNVYENTACKWNMPVSVSGLEKGKLICHSSYVTNYNIETHIPMWTSYVINETTFLGCYKKCGSFWNDPTILPNEQADPNPRNCVQRGHMAPRADLAYTLKTCQESYMTTNMALQFGSFNQGIWATLENRIRWWSLPRVQDGHTVQIIMGAKLMDGFSMVFWDGTEVPGIYFKIIIDLNTQEYDAYVFNVASSGDLADYRVDIFQIENLFEIKIRLGHYSKMERPINGDGKAYRDALNKKCSSSY